MFDGDCAFCTTSANFIHRWIPTDAKVVAWQRADLGSLGLSRRQCLDAVQWVRPGQAPLAGPEAIAALLRSSNLFWRPIGRLLGLAPVRVLAWPVYRWIARNRHRMPGGTPACAVNPAA